MKRNLRAFSVLLSLSGLMLANNSLADAASSSTTVTQTVQPGILALTSAPAAVMSSATLNGSNLLTANGSLGLMAVTDGRGTGPGWALTATTTPFSSIGTPAHISGTAGSLVTSGVYTGSASGTYTITIINGGSLGTATYSVSGLENQAATATGAATPIGTLGLLATFTSATYSAGDQWTIAVNTIPASNFTITPSAVTAVSGSTSGVTAGSAHTYSTGTDPATIMTATAGNGLGQYNDTPALSLSIPAGTKAGAYAATVTETVN